LDLRIHGYLTVPALKHRTANATAEAQEAGERKRKELNEILQPLYIQRKKNDVLQNMKVKIEKVSDLLEQDVEIHSKNRLVIVSLSLVRCIFASSRRCRLNYTNTF